MNADNSFREESALKKTLIIFAAAITVSAMLSGCLQPRNSGTGDSAGIETADTSDFISETENVNDEVWITEDSVDTQTSLLEIDTIGDTTDIADETEETEETDAVTSDAVHEETTPSDEIIYVSELTVGNAVLDPGKTFGEIIDGMFDYDTHPFSFRRSSVELYGFEAFCAADLENGRINETDRPEADGKYVVVVGFVLEDGYALAPGCETDLYTLDIYMDGYMAKLGLDSRMKYDIADVCFIAETGEYVINIILR